MLSSQMEHDTDTRWACGSLVALPADGMVVTGFSLLHQHGLRLGLAGFHAKVGQQACPDALS